jgi:ATP-dependent DNA helicase DinG
MQAPKTKPEPVNLPDVPILCVNARHAALLNPDGELGIISHGKARLLLHNRPALVCHAPYSRARLGLESFYAFDALELFAFVYPVRFCVPTPAGLCKALGFSVPEDFEDMPLALMDCVKAMLTDLALDPYKAKADPLKIAKVMGLNGKGWNWTPFVLSALGEKYDPKEPIFVKADLNIWKNLPEWAEEAPLPPPGHEGVSLNETHERLQSLLGQGSEKREQQDQYAFAMSQAFAPAQQSGEPHIVIAEAGTGVGKTLGYLAPASIWAEKNKGSVWISTFTKNLQRQIDQELSRLYPDPDVKDAHVTIRKGRENYLCLLNLEEMLGGAALAHHPEHAIAAGLMARWSAASRDGDLSGGDFPGWLPGLMGFRYTLALADRRGECIFSACDHYHKCFVERSVRKAKHARIVVANHALVMIQAALSQAGDDMPTRYIFDEGHHLFSTADSAFAAHLTAIETRDLRRWILGAEGGKQSRARGLKRRIEDLIAADTEAQDMLSAIIREAQSLTSEGWAKRLKDSSPFGACESFLHGVMTQVFARDDGRDGPYSLETEVFPLNDDLAAKAKALSIALKKLQTPMQELAKHIRAKLAADSGEMDSDTRKRLDSVAASLDRRGAMTLDAWSAMLKNLEKTASPQDSHEFIDWFEIERESGKALDVGYYRHWVDPMKPFALTITPHVHGLGITSATLRDTAENDNGWVAARIQTGLNHLQGSVRESAFASPFDYKNQARVFIINDVRKDDLDQVAGAYQALFQASGGGGIGLFTAISRLRSVHHKIAPNLEESGLNLYSQHVDDMDAGSLVDMFRDDRHACLLGTDAMRDGVDVPGDSLRLMVFDRVPWPRPTILHKARRETFGKKQYDEMITRMKLKQAFGRLVRRATDKGVFVMLDPMLPSRLHGAFPPETEIVKCGLGQAVQDIKEFLHGARG